MAGGLMIVAGEPSGDTIAAHALRELKSCAETEFPVFGVGGDELAAAGMEVCQHYRDIAVMGVFDVIRHLGRVLGAIRQVEKLARERRPDVLLLVDFSRIQSASGKETARPCSSHCVLHQSQILGVEEGTSAGLSFDTQIVSC